MSGTEYQPGDVQTLKAGGYMVASRTTPGAWWLVINGTCTCPAGRHQPHPRARCWHQRQVDLHVAAENKRYARPVAPVNVAAIFD